MCSWRVSLQFNPMPFDADAVHLGKQSVADDDEIIAGEQKMSLKCPVSPIDVDREGVSSS